MKWIRPFKTPAALLAVLSLAGTVVSAAERSLGDLDNDGVITVMDLTRQIAFMKGQLTLSDSEAIYADVNRDGVYNDEDSKKIVALILGTETPQVLAPANILSTSPSSGETGVAVTREFVVRFSMPLALDAVVSTHNPNTGEHGNFYAEFGGRKLLTRVELSGDRKKATLFFLEPVPSSARIRVTFDPTGVKDLLGREVDADDNGFAGGVATVDYDTLAIAPLTGTAVVGTVYGVKVGTSPSAKVPLQGVTITVDGAEQNLRTTTDADGKFVLSPAPVGRFFVLIDGRTATASDTSGYYAFVGKAWEGVAGKMDTPATPATDTNAAGDIYLPFIASDTLKAVSSVSDTAIPFSPAVLQANPQLEGVQITVPANSLFANSGARGGKVGIAPVSPDKLPEPLPAGLNFPLVITIQTDGGTNFDRPVPVRFPNLPDPVTGKKLKAGQKSALFSFNHETGTWEMAGAMTVTADGNFVETDKGVGVRKPGWHGPGPFGNSSGGGVPPCTDGMIGNNAQAMEKFKEAEDILKDKELDLAKTLLVEAGGAALSFVDPLLKTKDCIQQSLDGAPNFFGTKSLFYMPRGCVDMAIEFFLLPLEELKVAKKVGETAINAIKSAKAIGEFSDFVNDAMTMKEKFDEANSLLAQEAPCEPGGNSGDPRKPVLDAFNDFKKKSDDFVDSTQKADQELKKIDEGIKALDTLKGQLQNNDTLGLDHDAQANLANTIFDLAGAWYFLAGPGGYYDQANALISSWNAYQGRFLGYASGGSTRMVALSTGSTSPTMKRVIYLLEYGNVKQRQMKMNGGGYDFFMPANIPATVYGYEVDHKWIARIGPFAGPAAGTRITQDLHFHAQSSGALDTDNDGLTDDAERIVGSDPAKADTNGDGILDGAALQAGLDPTSGKPSSVGIIANLPTNGTAFNITSSGDLVVVSEGNKGIELYDGTDRGNPRRLGQLSLPGDSLGLALSSPWLAVSQGSLGVSIVNVTDPVSPVLARTLPLGAACQAVGAAGDLMIAGNDLGQLFVIDPSTQAIIHSRMLSGSIQDIAVNGSYVYVLIPGSLHVLQLDESGVLNFISTIPCNSYLGAGQLSRLRLFVALDRLYATSTNGVNVFNIGTDPSAPILLKNNTSSTQAGFKQLVMATPSLGLFTVGNNSTSEGPHHVQTYNIDAGGTLGDPTSILVTPGLARALTVVNGLAYVADSDSGLEVLNYLATDTGGVAPTITLGGSFPLSPSAVIEEGSRQTFVVDARDDVQVRNVELYIDGVLFRNDANFPFEFPFTSPVRTTTKTSFSMKVVAYDTAGNKTEVPAFTVNLVPDATPPRVTRTTPVNGSLVGEVNKISVTFSEAIESSTITSSSVLVRFAGPDDLFGTVDDEVVLNGTMTLNAAGTGLAIVFPTKLPAGSYRLEVGTGITDLAGNHLVAPVNRSFLVMGFTDTDGDGVPDNVEATLGLDPSDPDTNRNGISDGQEDYDHDGLPNAWEIARGYDPKSTDSDSNGIKDGEEDPDLDGLTNAQESTYSTNPNKADTDGDGWSDGTEVDGGGDALDASKKPHFLAVSSPPVSIVVPVLTSETVTVGTAVSRPSVQFALSALTSETTSISTVVSRPQVQVAFSALTTEPTIISTVVSRPSVQFALSATTTEATTITTVISSPPVQITLPDVSSLSGTIGTTVSQPKVEVQFPTN